MEDSKYINSMDFSATIEITTMAERNKGNDIILSYGNQ